MNTLETAIKALSATERYAKRAALLDAILGAMTWLLGVISRKAIVAVAHELTRRLMRDMAPYRIPEEAAA